MTGLELPLRTLTKSILQAGTQRPRQVGLESGSWGPPGGQSQQARAEGRELTRRATDPAGLVFGEDPGDLSPKASGLGLGPLCPPCPPVDMENVWRYYLWHPGGRGQGSGCPREARTDAMARGYCAPNVSRAEAENACRRPARRTSEASQAGWHCTGPWFALCQGVPYPEFQLQTSDLPARLHTPDSQAHQQPSDRKSSQSRDHTAASTSPPGCLPEVSLVDRKTL